MEPKTEKNGAFSWYFKANLLGRILFGLVLGAIVGIVLNLIFTFWKPPEVRGEIQFQ